MRIAIAILITGLIFYACHSKPAEPVEHNIPPPAADPGIGPPVGTTKREDKFHFSLNTAHPRAQALMQEDFYWSPNEETGPFGSDDSWAAAYKFREWRMLYKAGPPVMFVKQLVAGWGYGYFDCNEMDEKKIKDFIEAPVTMDEAQVQMKMKEFKKDLQNDADPKMRETNDTALREVILKSAAQMNELYLLGQDEAIIGTAFAQFALEGKIDADLKALTITAIKRQLLSVLIDRYDANYKGIRKSQLTKMLNVINKASS